MLEPTCITSVLSPETKAVFIAYSGGIDSHVLLHLSTLDEELKSKITAVYVHHGLQQEADEWAKHCKVAALNLGVKFKCLTVDIKGKAGQSLEELARDARYHVLESLLQPNDVLLLGQHREDQMETMLLQLFRGAGVQGLSAMPLIIPFGEGSMCRPFLDVSKQEIKDYAVRNQLFWVDDFSNKNDDFDRNFLRNQIVPQLRKKWPSLDKTVARSARHCANAQNIIDNLAKELFKKVYSEVDLTLNIAELIILDSNKQNMVLREWFKSRQLRMPSEKKLLGIVDEVINAKKSANPEIRGQGYSIRRYRNKLFCLEKTGADKNNCKQQWDKEKKQLILNAGSKLILSESDKGLLKKRWNTAEVLVDFRQGAEKIKVPAREGRHSLKKLYQEKAIPPWMRSEIPLIYLDGQLAAVADLWISDDFYCCGKGLCYRIDWLRGD